MFKECIIKSYPGIQRLLFLQNGHSRTQNFRNFVFNIILRFLSAQVSFILKFIIFKLSQNKKKFYVNINYVGFYNNLLRLVKVKVMCIVCPNTHIFQKVEDHVGLNPLKPGVH